MTNKIIILCLFSINSLYSWNPLAQMINFFRKSEVVVGIKDKSLLTVINKSSSEIELKLILQQETHEFGIGIEFMGPENIIIQQASYTLTIKPFEEIHIKNIESPTNWKTIQQTAGSIRGKWDHYNYKTYPMIIQKVEAETEYGLFDNLLKASLEKENIKEIILTIEDTGRTCTLSIKSAN